MADNVRTQSSRPRGVFAHLCPKGVKLHAGMSRCESGQAHSSPFVGQRYRTERERTLQYGGAVGALEPDLAAHTGNRVDDETNTFLHSAELNPILLPL